VTKIVFIIAFVLYAGFAVVIIADDVACFRMVTCRVLARMFSWAALNMVIPVALFFLGYEIVWGLGVLCVAASVFALVERFFIAATRSLDVPITPPKRFAISAACCFGLSFALTLALLLTFKA